VQSHLKLLPEVSAMARYTPFSVKLLHYIRRIITRRNSWASSVQIDDAVGEALLRFHIQVDEVRGDSDNEVGWMLHVAGNCLRDEHRRGRKFVDVLPDGEGNESFGRSADQSDSDAELATIRTLLATLLNERMRETVWLHDMEGWKPAEIAEEQGRSVNAVNHDIKRGHAKLRKVLKDEYMQFTPSPRKKRA
jgi:RNA polymerase sigma factor (sigma-70 family)